VLRVNLARGFTQQLWLEHLLEVELYVGKDELYIFGALALLRQ